MNKEQIKEYILKNEGLTLEVDTLEPSQKKDGFMVSLYGSEEQIKDINKLVNKIMERAEKLKKANKKNMFVGVWLYNGVYYLDYSINIKDYKKAVEFGKNNKQLAIYDLKNNTSINIEYKKIKYFTLYQVIKNNNNEIVNEIPIKQYDSIKEIEKDLKIKSNCIYKTIKRHSLIDTMFYLYEDYINEFDLI
ncbi:MAG: hypothetical protein MSA56_06000 [Clostridium sp.]|nr:hypothetical protein [Clostridium sp.]